MGFLDRLLPKRNPLSDHILTGGGYSFIFGSTSSGRPVTERSAMQMTAVYSCVRILADAVAGLPLHVYRQRPDGGKEKALDHPLYRLLHDEPNPEMTSFVFRETLMTHLLLWGNAFAQVTRNGRDEVVGLYPLMPNRSLTTAQGHARLINHFAPTRSGFAPTPPQMQPPSGLYQNERLSNHLYSAFDTKN